ncbi:MAG TPA: hypothetical protein VKB29_08110, partial [Candidatus Binataceae bacterium]|nr:hypothetical protein [Candidatus Binataceae bacterium]
MRSVNRSIWPCARFLVIFRDAGAVISTRPDFHRRSVLPSGRWVPGEVVIGRAGPLNSVTQRAGLAEPEANFAR